MAVVSFTNKLEGVPSDFFVGIHFKISIQTSIPFVTEENGQRLYTFLKNYN